MLPLPPIHPDFVKIGFVLRLGGFSVLELIEMMTKFEFQNDHVVMATVATSPTLSTLEPIAWQISTRNTFW